MVFLIYDSKYLMLLEIGSFACGEEPCSTLYGNVAWSVAPSNIFFSSVSSYSLFLTGVIAQKASFFYSYSVFRYNFYGLLRIHKISQVIVRLVNNFNGNSILEPRYREKNAVASRALSVQCTATNAVNCLNFHSIQESSSTKRIIWNLSTVGRSCSFTQIMLDVAITYDEENRMLHLECFGFSRWGWTCWRYRDELVLKYRWRLAVALFGFEMFHYLSIASTTVWRSGPMRKNRMSISTKKRGCYSPGRGSNPRPSD